MEKIRAHIFVSGMVQGVFFRTSAQRKAQELGLTGWARNMPLSDGRVEIVVEGEKEKIELLLEWCKKGPELAEVKDVRFECEDYKDEFEDFGVA